MRRPLIFSNGTKTIVPEGYRLLSYGEIILENDLFAGRYKSLRPEMKDVCEWSRAYFTINNVFKEHYCITFIRKIE